MQLSLYTWWKDIKTNYKTQQINHIVFSGSILCKPNTYMLLCYFSVLTVTIEETHFVSLIRSGERDLGASGVITLQA
jgi:hypothetical protein